MSPEDYEDYKVKGREKKLEKKKKMMKVNGRGLKSTILPLLGKRAKEAKTDFSRMRVTQRYVKTYQYDY